MSVVLLVCVCACWTADSMILTFCEQPWSKTIWSQAIANLKTTSIIPASPIWYCGNLGRVMLTGQAFQWGSLYWMGRYQNRQLCSSADSTFWMHILVESCSSCLEGGQSATFRSKSSRWGGRLKMWNLHVSMVGFLVSPAHCNVTGMKLGQGNYPPNGRRAEGFQVAEFLEVVHILPSGKLT